MKSEEPKVATKSHLIHSGVDIVKNTSTKTPPKTNLTKNGRKLESFMESIKEEPKVQEKKEEPKQAKPANKKGRGGVFIGSIDE